MLPRNDYGDPLIFRVCILKGENAVGLAQRKHLKSLKNAFSPTEYRETTFAIRFLSAFTSTGMKQLYYLVYNASHSRPDIVFTT